MKEFGFPKKIFPPKNFFLQNDSYEKLDNFPI